MWISFSGMRVAEPRTVCLVVVPLSSHGLSSVFRYSLVEREAVSMIQQTIFLQGPLV